MAASSNELFAGKNSYQPLLDLFTYGDLNSQKESLGALPESVRQKIFSSISILSGQPLEVSFGAVQAFEDLPRFERAVQRVALGVLDEEEKVFIAGAYICKNLDINDLKEVVVVLRDLERASPGKTGDLATAAVKICKNLEIKSLQDIACILRELEKAAPGEREEIAGVVAYICGELGFKGLQDVLLILRRVEKIASGERAEIATAAVYNCKELGARNAQWVESVLTVLERVAPGEREQVSIAAVKICKELKPWSPRSLTVILILALLPESSRKVVTESMRQYRFPAKVDCCGDFIRYFLDQNPKLRKSWEEYLMGRLENETNPLGVRGLAKMILERRGDLFLLNEHRLAQQALSVVIATEDPKNPKNPYSIYSMLNKARGAPCIYVDQPPKEAGDRVVYFNQKVFIAQDSGALRFKDLSSGINERTPRKLLNNFNQRIASLSQDERDRLEQHIRGSYEIGLDSCERSLNGSYLKKLLSKSGEPEEKVPLHQAFLVAILKHILDQPAEISPGKLFSVQEEALFGLASATQKCEAAAAEGIALMYNQLPMKYKYSQQEQAGMRTTEKAVAQLNVIVQQVFNDLLSADNSMMRELTGAKGETEQLPHQSLFLKNRIASHVGFEHMIQFDQHTHTLYKQLLERTSEELLTCFYTHLSIEAFIRALRFAFDNNQDLYPLLNCLLDEKRPMGMDSSRVWELQDDDETVSLTEYGALNIWIAGGFLTQ